MMIMYNLNFAKDSWMCSQKDLIGCGNISRKFLLCFHALLGQNATQKAPAFQHGAT